MTTEQRIKSFWLHIDRELPDDAQGAKRRRRLAVMKETIDHVLAIITDRNLCDLCLGTGSCPDSPGFCPRCF